MRGIFKMFQPKTTEFPIRQYPKEPTWKCEFHREAVLFGLSVTFNICQNYNCPHCTITKYGDGASFMSCGELKDLTNENKQ